MPGSRARNRCGSVNAHPRSADFFVIAALGSDDANHFNTADVIGAISVGTGLLGLVPYGTLKILYNPDPGPFRPTSTISKGIALTFSL